MKHRHLNGYGARRDEIAKATGDNLPESFAHAAEIPEGGEMSDIRRAREALVSRIIEGEGKSSSSERRSAFENRGLPDPLRVLTDKVARYAYRVTDEDIAAARASGFSEDQIFEIVVSAAVGQAARQYDSALAALETATAKE